MYNRNNQHLLVGYPTTLEVKYMILLITIVVVALILLAIVAILMHQIFNTSNYQARVVPIVVKTKRHPRNH